MARKKGEQVQLDGMPPVPVTVHLSGSGTAARVELSVDDDVLLLARGTVRKVGLAHTPDGVRPFVAVQAETVRLLSGLDGALLDSLGEAPPQAG